MRNRYRIAVLAACGAFAVTQTAAGGSTSLMLAACLPPSPPCTSVPPGMVDEMSRSVLSPIDRRRPSVRWTLLRVHALLLVFLVIVGLGPLLWLAKAAVSTTQDTLRFPMSLWPSGFDFENLAIACRSPRSVTTSSTPS